MEVQRKTNKQTNKIMGMNSTTAYNFGQFGSTFLSGDGAILDLSQTDAKYYVFAL